MSASKTFTLGQPIVRRLKSVGGEERIEELAELTFRPLKGKDLRGAPSNEADLMLHLLARAAGLTHAEIDEMDFADVTGAVEVIADFLPVGLKTGLTASAT